MECIEVQKVECGKMLILGQMPCRYQMCSSDDPASGSPSCSSALQRQHGTSTEEATIHTQQTCVEFIAGIESLSTGWSGLLSRRDPHSLDEYTTKKLDDHVYPKSSPSTGPSHQISR